MEQKSSNEVNKVKNDYSDQINKLNASFNDCKQKYDKLVHESSENEQTLKDAILLHVDKLKNTESLVQEHQKSKEELANQSFDLKTKMESKENHNKYLEAKLNEIESSF